MKVRLKRVHQAWNILYPNTFEVGGIFDLEGRILVAKDGRKFLADEMCKTFNCSYPDIFDKVEEDE